MSARSTTPTGPRRRRDRSGASPSKVDLHGDGGQVAHLGQRAHLDEPPSRRTADPVAQGLDLAEQVGGEEDRLAPRPGLADAAAELVGHEGVETGGRLVEDQQVGTGRQRGDQRRPSGGCPWSRPAPSSTGRGRTARRARPGRPASTEPCTRPSRCRVSAPVRFGHSDVLAADVGQPAVDGHGVAPAVESEQLGRARGGPDQAEQQADGGRLAGPVGPEVADHLAGGHLEVEVDEGIGAAVALGEPAGADDRRVGHPHSRHGGRGPDSARGPHSAR